MCFDSCGWCLLCFYLVLVVVVVVLWRMLSWFLFGKCLLVLVIWWFGFWFVARLVWRVAGLCWLYSACVLAVLLQVGLRLGFGG